MKNFNSITLVAAFAASVLSLVSLNANAQDQKNSAPPGEQNRPTPEQMVARQTTHLQKMLGLTEDQKVKVQQALTERVNATKKIRDKFGPQPDRKAMRAEMKPVREQYVQTMNSILTPEQKTKWDEHRKKMKQHMMQRENRNQPQQENGGNGQIQKLLPDDDGIDE